MMDETGRMQEPEHVELLSAIENDEFERARDILANDHENKWIGPLGALRVTALQMAAWRGRLDLLESLYEKGADVNDSDKIGRSALYHAAHNGYADVVAWLLERGAYVDAKVGVHSCAKDPSQPMLTKTPCFIGRKLPLPMCWGKTPLHQAVRNNHADVVRILVNAGANVNAKDECMSTPLHLAGGSIVHPGSPDDMTKFVDIVGCLVGAKANVNDVHPDTGTTALHHAASLGSAEATRILLSNDAWPMYGCKSSGSTPLHMAACSGNVDTLKTLLGAIRPCNVDIRDHRNRTALHRAAYQGHDECVRILVRHGGNLAAMTKTGVTVVDAIFAHIPRPLDFLTDMLDSCIRALVEKDQSVVVDFGILAPKREMQMAVVTAMIAAATDMAQLSILQHPLVESFLRLKWARLRVLFFVLLLVHLIFVIFLSMYAVMLVHDDPDCVAIRRILLVCSCILLLHNGIQVWLEPKHYLRQLETWLSLVCATLSLVTSMAGEIVRCDVKSRDCWVLHFLSIAILLSWMQMMLLIGRFPMCGYYALMFSTVLKNILKVLLAFGYLIIGFALSFSVLFHGNQQFNNFWVSLVKTVVMMMGEYEYKELLSTDEDDQSFLPITSRIVFFAFILLAGIVLINLMIGLAVNDIQALEREGHIRRLLKQAEFVAHLERLTSHRISRSNWLHPRFKMLWHSRRDIPRKIILSSRENTSPRIVDSQFPTRTICIDLMEPLLQLAAKTASENDNLTNTNIPDTKLSRMLINLEEQIRELKTYCCRDRAGRSADSMEQELLP